jgi:SAM-dependent methyltransferase
MLMNPTRITRAIATNVLAYLAPRYYLKITEQTGRGDGDTEPEQVAEYFYQCFKDYIDQLSLSLDQTSGFLKGKTLLEYGPGDTPGVALLFYAFGAESIVLVDRFPMLKLDTNNLTIISALMEKLSEPEKARVARAFKKTGNPESGFKEEVIRYRTHPKGLSDLHESIDMVYSRAVLEHVIDLEASFRDMFNALKPGGIAVHQVDLKSHGLHKNSPLDFLIWPSWLWWAMYSGKGVPNRWRIDKYRDILSETGLVTTELKSTAAAAQRDIVSVRTKLASTFSGISDQDLSCLGFWLHFYKPVVTTRALD